MLCRYGNLTHVERLTSMRSVVATVALLASLALGSCDASPPDAPAEVETRLVGAHGLALAVPANWETDVERDSTCPPIDPNTVVFFEAVRGPYGSCAVPDGASWPAEDSLSVYAKSPGETRTFLTGQPTGWVDGMPYYISYSRQLGPGAARRLVVPQAGVEFVVGAATTRAADALLATIQSVPPGTPLR